MIQNKHIIRLSFIGLFLNIVANIILYRYFMIEEVVLKHIAEQNFYIAETYKNKVWDANRVAIKKIKNDNYQKLLQDQDFIKLAKESTNFLTNINADIDLFDSFGNKFLVSHDNNINHVDEHNSNNLYDKILLRIDKYFLKDYISSQALAESFRGKTRHSLVSRAIITDQNDNSYEKTFINSYIPIIDTSMGNFLIEGVMQINTDITEQWDNITYLEKRIFVAFVIVFLVFFIIVMYNTNYAQRVINQQSETNRALEEAKIRAERESSAKTEFLANISHELRTPLNAIIGFSEIMISETYGKIENKQYQDYINDINNSGQHLLSVINDILDFAKASADKLKVDHVELDLNKLASSSMRFVKPRADEAGVQLIEELPPEHIIIFADPKRLKQALLNLLSNAVKFTDSGQSVTLSLTKIPDKKLVNIQVIDTGIGMNEKDIPKALSSFGQVDNKLSRKYEGTGLGLPLTKKLVELMQGTFDLQSKVGAGTTVTLTFAYSEIITL
ncbi:MAG: sensor histidine kinase [Rickettsiaceae bacterium]|nr:sensor histidine kinase [Rickettsiaceae bacterium]